MEDIEKEPSIGISYNLALGNNKSLVLQSFIERDCEPKVLNAMLDKLRVATERQAAFFALEGAKAELARQEKMAADHARRMAQVDENFKAAWNRGNRKGDPVLTAKERTEQQQAYANAEEIKVRIAMTKKDIADFEAIIGA